MMRLRPLRKMIFMAGIVFYALLQSTVFAAAPLPDSVAGITADAAVLLNENTGEVLYEKNATKREYPASMTKMMTTILALEKGNPDQAVTISDDAADVECTRVVSGQQIRLKDLLQQMMMISDNGAALAIGETLGGTQENFAAMMNLKAKQIGAESTHFVNPNGMPDGNHYSTAMDMAKIAAYGMHNQQFRNIVGTRQKMIYYIQPAGYKTYCENSNELLYSYDGCTGIKTGWTSAARGCLAAAAKRGNTELLVVVMHAGDDESRFVDAAALLDYGFSYFKDGSAKN